MPASGEQRGQRQHDAAARGRAALQLEAVYGRQHVVAAGGGCLHHGRRAGEGHHADFHLARQVLDEGLGRYLGSQQPVGLDVFGAHAARHVHRQDDGAFRQRQRDRGRRPGHGQQQHGECREQQGRRHMPAPARAGAQRGLGHRDAGQPHRAAALACQQPAVQPHQQWQQQQQPQQVGPDELHHECPGALEPTPPTAWARRRWAGKRSGALLRARRRRRSA